LRSKARDYSQQTLKKLFALSGNQCAFPGCTHTLVNQENAKDSNICHIEAAKKDGERYRETMTDKERADYENLILLCVQHHDETNNEDIYTVEVLKDMKRSHESSILTRNMNKNPSMLINTINAISEIDIVNIDKNKQINPFNPKDKIDYNSIKRNVALINEYKIYSSKINSLYDELEQQGSIKKEKLLASIELIYTEIKGNYVLDSTNPMEIIKSNADNIIDDVYETLNAKVSESSFWEEDIVLGIRLIMVDAFMRCKILEEPK
jgi:hypothetical protein